MMIPTRYLGRPQAAESKQADQKPAQTWIGYSEMFALKAAVGKSVAVEYVHNGTIYDVVGKLKRVDDFWRIEVHTTSPAKFPVMPFVGKFGAVRTISVKEGEEFEEVYNNRRNIPENYERADNLELSRLRVASFGEANAQLLEKRE